MSGKEGIALPLTTFSGTMVHNLHGIYVPTLNDAVEWTRALLHTILFLRLLGLCEPREQWCVLSMNDEEVSYAAVHSRRVEQRVERVIHKVKRALGDATLARVAQVQLDLGTSHDVGYGGLSADDSIDLADEPIGSVNSWATWVTNSLGRASSHQTRSHAVFDHKSQRLQSYESWTFRLYIVDRSLAQRRYRSLSDTLSQVVQLANDGTLIDRLPDCGDRIESYRFDTHVRGVTALQPSLHESRVQQPHRHQQTGQNLTSPARSSNDRISVDDFADDFASASGLGCRPPASRPMDIPLGGRDAARRHVTRTEYDATVSQLQLTDSAEQDWFEVQNACRRRPSSTARSPPTLSESNSPPSPTARHWWNSLRWSSGGASATGSGSWTESLQTLRDVLQNAPTATGRESL